ncbi:MAG TPA: ribonuclease H-like domain-containing protein [Candidatus Thermoplasmatota archaeon]|nr:ribonuclease H-like domain-containing protein [Candidatus Thermoplasmatota archaeon]
MSDTPPSAPTPLQPVEAPPDLLELPTIKQTNAGRIAAVTGIRTRKELLEWDYSVLYEKLHGVPETRDIANRLDLLRGYARAQLEGRPILYGVDPLLMDPPGPVWFFDLEFDSEGTEIFLFGWKKWGGDVHQAFGATKEERRDLLLEFFDHYYRDNPLLVTYGSRNSDEPFLRRAAENYRIPKKLVQGLRWYDMQDRVIFTGSPEAQMMYLPLNSFKLDAVGKYFGRSGKPAGNITSGLHIVHLYRRYKNSRDPRIRERLLEYNAEDLYLSEAVYEGLRQICRTVPLEKG